MICSVMYAEFLHLNHCSQFTCAVKNVPISIGFLNGLIQTLDANKIKILSPPFKFCICGFKTRFFFIEYCIYLHVLSNLVLSDSV